MANSTKKVGIAAALATVITISAEGIRQFAYYDPPGILTVCYGTTGKDVVKGKRYTLSECRALLDRDILKAVNAVNDCAPNLPDNVLAAFGDAAYNIGPKVACDKKKSTAARYLAQGRLREACSELLKWDKARIAGVLVALPGLTKRRKAEQELCRKGLI